MTIYKPFLPILLIIGLFFISCSGQTGSPVMPGQAASDLTPASAASSVAGTSKALWGIWNVSIDTENWEASIVPIRGPQYTVDVVKFLQPPAGNPMNLTIAVTDITEWFSLGKIGVDVGLKHPFPGLDQYTGFDVYGVFVAQGSISGEYDTDVAYTNGDDESILLNPDGYTRWMNPVEFVENGKFFNFITGKLGTKDIGLFTSTINAYKYFADGLEKDQPVNEFFAEDSNALNRGTFKPGSYNQREYDLKFPLVGGTPKLIFQYAVVASWVDPDPALSGDPDQLDVPGDFPISANADEAFFLQMVDNSTLYYSGGVGGGSVNMQLEIFDWGSLPDGKTVADEIHQIVVENPYGVIPGDYVLIDQPTLSAIAAPGSSMVSSVFNIDIANCTPNSTDDVPLLITIESSEPQAFDTGIGIPANDDRLAAYFRIGVPVSDLIPSSIEVISPNGGETLYMAMSHEITWDPGPGIVSDIKIEWSTDNFVSDVNTIVDSTPNNGSYTWDPIPNVETTTARIRITDASGTESDTSDGDFSIKLPIWLNVQDAIIADNDTVTFSSWPHYHYGDEYSPAIAQATGGMVWVIWANYNPGGSDDTQIHSSDGTNWSGTGNCFGTSAGANYRGDRYKVAPGQDNWIYATIVPFFTGMTVMNRLYYAAWNYNFSGGSTSINNEMAVDQAGYIYCFTDGGTGISVVRSSSPNSAALASGYGSVTADAEISHVRSWAPVGAGLAIAWYNSAGEIRASL
ncbi:MAG: hypothetical protein ABIC40_00010, partial [bacterium]